MIRHAYTVYSGSELWTTIRELHEHKAIRVMAKHGSTGLANEYISYTPHTGFLGSDRIGIDFEDGRPSMRVDVEVVLPPVELEDIDIRLEDARGYAVMLTDNGIPQPPMRLIIENIGDHAAWPLRKSGQTKVRLAFRKGIIAPRLLTALENQKARPRGSGVSDLLGLDTDHWSLDVKQPEPREREEGIGVALEFAYHGDLEELEPGAQIAIPLNGLVADPRGGARPTRFMSTIQVVTFTDQRAQLNLSLVRPHALEIMHPPDRKDTPIEAVLAGGSILDGTRQDNVVVIALKNALGRTILPKNGETARLQLSADAGKTPWALCDVAALENVRVSYQSSGSSEATMLEGPAPGGLSEGRSLWRITFPEHSGPKLPDIGDAAYLVLSGVPGRPPGDLPRSLQPPCHVDDRRRPVPLELSWTGLAGVADGAIGITPHRALGGDAAENAADERLRRIEDGLRREYDNRLSELKHEMGGIASEIEDRLRPRLGEIGEKVDNVADAKSGKLVEQVGSIHSALNKVESRYIHALDFSCGGICPTGDNEYRPNFEFISPNPPYLMVVPISYERTSIHFFGSLRLNWSLMKVKLRGLDYNLRKVTSPNGQITAPDIGEGHIPIEPINFWPKQGVDLPCGTLKLQAKNSSGRTEIVTGSLARKKNQPEILELQLAFTDWETKRRTSHLARYTSLLSANKDPTYDIFLFGTGGLWGTCILDFNDAVMTANES